MNVLRTYLMLAAIIAFVHLFAGCSKNSSGPDVSSDPAGLCKDDQDEPGDVDDGDSEDDDGTGSDDAGECDDD